MRKKVASALGLLAFAVMAVLGAISGSEMGPALSRALLSAAVMAVVGYVVGFIAEKAVLEAVEAKAPLDDARDAAQSGKGAGERPAHGTGEITKGSTNVQEEDEK